MGIRDSQRIKEIRDNTRAMAEAFGRIADTLAEALELYVSTQTEALELYVSTQTETQNSNLTFEKDECAKEYEELGLKELKELIEADRKDEPQTCDTCKYGEDKHRYAHICNECGVGINNYEPKDEPQTERSE